MLEAHPLAAVNAHGSCRYNVLRFQPCGGSDICGVTPWEVGITATNSSSHRLRTDTARVTRAVGRLVALRGWEHFSRHFRGSHLPLPLRLGLHSLMGSCCTRQPFVDAQDKLERRDDLSAAELGNLYSPITAGDRDD